MPARLCAEGSRSCHTAYGQTERASLTANPRSICGYCLARQSVSLNMCGYGFALCGAGKLPGALEWNVDFFGPGKTRGPDRSGPGTSG